MKVFLLVTLIVGGQPQPGYQVQFNSWSSCAAARDAVLQDRQRVNVQDVQVTAECVTR